MTTTWHEANTGNDQGLIIDDETGRNVAVSYEKQDAKLIAAAPELLEALKSVMEVLAWIPVDVFTVEGRNDMRKRVQEANNILYSIEE